ncbi:MULTISPECIES: DUF4876 domain-containing protein [Chitinophagaceae]
MKRVLYLLLFSTIALVSCSKHDNDSAPGIDLKTVTVQLVYPSGSTYTVQEGVTVKMTSTNATSSFDAATDASGKATFNVPIGLYQLSATDIRSEGGTGYVYNGLLGNLTVSKDSVTWGTKGNGYSLGNSGSNQTVDLQLTESQPGHVIIKEIFVGGSLKDDGSGTFAFDKYITLYNNSSDSNAIINLDSICLAMISPYNSQASNGYYDASGNLTYVSEGWIPAVQGYWYFQQNVTLAPGKQLVIALNNAVDNTLTYSKSINFNHSDYYCTYDVNKFANANYYVTPGDSIPTSHYMKVQTYGAGNAWSISVTSPGVFLFTPKDGYTPSTFAADATLTNVLSGYTSKKVPIAWVVDGVEGFLLNNAANKKRFPASIDAGYVYHLNNQGYSIYRNVDKAATEALPENAGKIVTSYNLGTTDIGGTTDPSGIDAEASIKKGARIIYKDTQNSTNDFHLRKKASLSNY